MSTPPVREVTLADLPVQTFLDLQRHIDDMLREFALIALDQEGGGGDAVPALLLAIIGDWRSRFRGPRALVLDQLHEAADRGEERVAITVTMPVAAAAAFEEATATFEAADEFCRSGDLLTLATNPEVAAFRRWLCDEVVAQLTD